MKRKRLLVILYITLLTALLSCVGLPARAAHYFFEQISLQEGLPSTVRCVLTDEEGFVWIGTKSGLGRFDGHELKKYQYDVSNPRSLPHNLIYQLLEDEQHNIWILTQKGLARYRRASDDFDTFSDEGKRRITALSACLTPEGVLFGSANKVYFYRYDDSSLRLLKMFASEPNFNITALSLWDRETILCCNRWQGMRLLDLRTGTSSAPPFDCGREIMCMLNDSKGRIWIAPYNQGVRCYSHDGKLLASYHTSNSPLSHNVVLSLAERDSQIWIATDGGGINILTPETGKFSLLEHIPREEHYALPSNSILCLYADRNNNMWAGSIRNGLFNIREVSMKTYTDVVPGNSRGLTNNTILSLYHQSPDCIWIGTDGGGINCYNPRTEKFAHYPSTWEDKVASITAFTPGKLLISLFNKGLFVFDPITGKKQSFTIIDPKTTALLCNRGKAVNLYQNAPNTVLILGDHVYEYDLNTRRFRVAIEKEKKDIVGTLLPICHTKERTYLHDIHRIYELNNETHRLTPIFEVQKDTVFNSVSRDEHGCFWIGSNHGISQFVSTTGIHRYVSTTLFEEVVSVECDRRGKVWIGTDKMLFAWLIDEKKFVLFGESDGALLNEYMPKPRLLTQEGDVYLGGVNGLLHIRSDLQLETTEIPRLQLSDIIVNGESAYSQLTTDATPGISVPWNSNVALRIMTREQDIFRQKAYRYRIAGLNDQSTESYNPELVLRSLPPGNYRIMASCTSKDGSWIPDREVLVLTVLPPWYQTWWFVTGCALLASALIIGTFRRILRRKEEKLRWEMKEHEQQMYEEKVRFLINISHELRTPLTLIHAPLSRVLKSLSPTDGNFLSLKSVYRQSQRMKNLINMVLDVRKMEVNGNRLQVEPHSLNEWIENLAQDFVPEGEAKRVSIRYRFDPRVGVVSFNKDKCEIILNNLLINALKHSPEETDITIASELLTGGERVRVSVTDRGCGLQHVDMNKLFVRFYQGGNEQSGTGIGLSYSKILAELHGGSIGACNNGDGPGATFFFELPATQIPGEIVSSPRAYLNELITDDAEEILPAEADFDISACTVLVVDDSRDLTDFLKKTLAAHFKRVDIAGDGVEALALIKAHAPDIVVSDVMMPRMNGYELCKNIKEDLIISHIPVVLLTARDDDESQLSGYKSGADAYLTKPFEVEMLLALIRNRLRERASTKKRYLSTGVLPLPEDNTFSPADETFLMKLNKIINEHLEDTRLDVAFLCKAMGMSRASLYNKLKAVTAMGAGDYINKIRMEHAIRLVTTTNLSIVEISEKTGFTTARYFSTAFKQYTGETPTKYKEKVKQKAETPPGIPA